MVCWFTKSKPNHPHIWCRNGGKNFPRSKRFCTKSEPDGRRNRKIWHLVRTRKSVSKPTQKILGNILLLLGAAVALRFGLLSGRNHCRSQFLRQSKRQDRWCHCRCRYGQYRYHYRCQHCRYHGRYISRRQFAHHDLRPRPLLKHCPHLANQWSQKLFLKNCFLTT